MVDPQAIAAWRRSCNAGEALPDDRLLALAAEVPELVAEAVADAFKRIQGAHKRPMAGVLAATGFAVTVAILDRLRREAPAVPELETLPEKLVTLRAIFDDSGKVNT